MEKENLDITILNELNLTNNLEKILSIIDKINNNIEIIEKKK